MRQGFTLIELMIVIAIIAIIASIAIPNLMESKMTANEAAAAASLKSIFTGQVTFQGGGFQDSNSNNTGEYGHIQHLNGVTACTGASAGDLDILTGPLATMNAGNDTATASAYNFAMYTPSATGTAAAYIPEGDALADLTVANADPQAERAYLCACAPQKLNESGRRVFIITQDSQVRSPTAIANRDVWFDSSDENGTDRTELDLGVADAVNSGNDLTAIVAAYPFYSK